MINATGITVSVATLISILSLLFAVAAMSYSFHLHRELNRLKRDHQRTRLLNRITDCVVVIDKILIDLERYDSFRQLAFGDNPGEAPDLNETLTRIEELRLGMSGYDGTTPMKNLVDATDRIEKVLALMNGIAARSPRKTSVSR